MILSFFQLEDGISFWSNNINIIHLHLVFAVLFLISYSIKSLLFLSGKRDAFLAFKKKNAFSGNFILHWVLGFRVLDAVISYKKWKLQEYALAGSKNNLSVDCHSIRNCWL
jgi:hypothetical protein